MDQNIMKIIWLLAGLKIRKTTTSDEQ